MKGLEREVDEGIVEVGNALTVEVVAEAVPGPFGGGSKLAPVEEDVALVGVEGEGSCW